MTNCIIVNNFSNLIFSGLIVSNTLLFGYHYHSYSGRYNGIVWFEGLELY